MRRKLQNWWLIVPLLAGGCMTNKLWTENTLDDWNEPAAQTNLRVFNSAAQKDFLIVYDEHSERHDATRTRAYFLNQNLGRLAERRAPHFVSPDIKGNFTALSLFHEPAHWGSHEPVKPFVVSGTNAQSFIIYFADGESETYQLPVYADNIGNYERTALTPVAVTVDLTIIGGVIGYTWLSEGAPGLVHQP